MIGKKYIGFIFKEHPTGIYIGIVPDLTFTSSYGRNFEEASFNLREACELYIEDNKERDLPEPSDLGTLLETEGLPNAHTITYINL